MPRLRRQKSRKQQVADLAVGYLKLKAAGKAAKGARKAAKGTAVYSVAKRTPYVKRIPIVLAGAGLAGFAAFKALKSGGDESVVTA